MDERLTRVGTALSFGILCHVLFAASVGMMIFQMYFGMSCAFGSLHFPWSYISNTLLLLQFPLAHSFLLSSSGRNWLKSLAPAPYASSLVPTVYVIVASLQVLLLFNLWTFSGIIWWQATGVTLWVITALYAASWLLLGKAILDAGLGLQSGWIGWSAVFRDRKPVYPGLPTGGLFRFCRQPIYLAFACTLWTVPRWTPDQLVIATVLTCYCLIGPLFKEARFSRMFGQAFVEYQDSRPYWLPLPWLTATVVQRNDFAIYDCNAEHWWDGSQRWLRVLQNMVPVRLSFFSKRIDWHSKSVLDLGCGGGFMSEALARRGAFVTGIDPSTKSISIAARHAAEQGLKIEYHVAPGEHLPLAGASMDCVVCVDVLEHVIDLGTVLDEIARVLRPGGIFAFDTINRTALAKLMIVTIGESVIRLLPRGTHDPVKFITPDEIASELTARGFSGIELKGFGPVGINHRLDFVFGHLPFLHVQYMGVVKLDAPVSSGN
jgi:methanethiol S-methyltransferase